MNIAALRKKAGLTQKTLAEALEVSDAAVAQWETGASMPVAAKLPRLACVLGCTIDDLFKEED